MRTIKFRAWSNKWDKMIYHNLDGYTIDVHANTAWMDGCDDECVVLMQFTSLLDKNGKEIYEGDIVNQDGYSVNVEVVFYGSRFCLKKQMGFSDYIPAKNLIVIGNVYENPELLK
jgi:uncharacterized phage protein (TIGR01671 family)